MDPISITLGAVSLVTALIRTAQAFLEFRRAKTEAQFPQNETPQGATVHHVENLQNQYNIFISGYGGLSESQGTRTTTSNRATAADQQDIGSRDIDLPVKEIQNILKKANSLVPKQKQLEAAVNSGADVNSLEPIARELLNSALGLKGRLDKVLQRFKFSFSRKGSAAEPIMLDRSLKLCDAALLFQQSKAVDTTPAAGEFIICNHCHLEVANYPTKRLSKQGKAVESSNMWLASHLVACKSFSERRAFYRCLACLFERREVANFESARDLERHLRVHPDFVYIPRGKEEEAEAELQKTIERAIHEEVPEPEPPEEASKPGSATPPDLERGPAETPPSTSPSPYQNAASNTPRLSVASDETAGTGAAADPSDFFPAAPPAPGLYDSPGLATSPGYAPPPAPADPSDDGESEHGTTSTAKSRRAFLRINRRQVHRG